MLALTVREFSVHRTSIPTCLSESMISTVWCLRRSRAGCLCTVAGTRLPTIYQQLQANHCLAELWGAAVCCILAKCYTRPPLNRAWAK